MKRFISLCGLVVACLLVVECTVGAADPSFELTTASSAVARGGVAELQLLVRNEAAAPLQGCTALLPLCVGFDQWRSELRIDGGGWEPYPANGMIPLGTLPAATTRTLDVRAFVESGAPAVLEIAGELFDSTGRLAEASTTVNVLPSVDAGADLMVDRGWPVEMTGASASDGDGTIASWTWTDHGAGGAFTDPSAAHPTYTSPERSGLVELTLTVTDADGGAASDSLRVRVNVPPSVEAGPDGSVVEGGHWEFAAATVQDEDGWIVSIAWNDGGAGGRFEPSSTVLHPTYIAPEVPAGGDRDVRLTVSAVDDAGAEGLDTATIRVHDVNVPPTVDVGPDRSVEEGGRLWLCDRAIVGDEDGRIVAYAWSDGGAGGGFEPSASVACPSYLAPRLDGCDDEEIELALRVLDDGGEEAVDTVVVRIVNVNHPPRVEVAGNLHAVEGQSITLAATASDEDGDRLEVLWEQTGGPPAAIASDDGSAAVRFPAPEVDVPQVLGFRVTATDPCGAYDTASVTIEVSPKEEPRPRTPLPSQLLVEIEAFDSDGMPLLPFDTVERGRHVALRMTVTNGGETTIEEIVVMDEEEGEIAWGAVQLDPGQRRVHEVDRQVGGTDRSTWRLVARGIDPHGDQVTAWDEFTLYVEDDSPTLELLLDAEPEQVTVGETVRLRYTLRNLGSARLSGITLRDDRIGRIPLSAAELAPGASCSVDAEIPLTGEPAGGVLLAASASGYTARGKRIEVRGTVQIVVSASVAGGGGEASSWTEPTLRISEIAWAGTPSDPEGEWIELVNIGPSPVDLEGWKLTWRDATSGDEPSDGCILELRGRVEPAGELDRDGGFRFVPTGHGVWSVVDRRWTGGRDRGSSGFFLLERGSDAVVADLPADLVYDRHLELPDAGAAVTLLDPAGHVVDSANATRSPITGWPAGRQVSTATMERIDPREGDHPENWQTNPGVTVRGRDVGGRNVTGTPGGPNAPCLATLTREATAVVVPTLVEQSITVSLPDAADHGAPVVRLAVVAGEVAGSGGAASGAALSTSRGSGDLRLSVDLAAAVAGVYHVWISCPDGLLFVLALVK